MKRSVFLLFCVYLCRGISASEADLLAALKAEEIPLEAQVLTGEKLVEYLKKNQNLFEVEITPNSHNFRSRLMDLKFINQNKNPVVDDPHDNGEDIPESFDGRKVWANCTSLFYIRDQANCGSCWAVSTAAAISDRLCIHSKGKIQVQISAAELVACCSQCGFGCSGGWPIEAWKYFIYAGLVTGGNYKSKGCCRPYEIHPCGHHGNEPYYGECPDNAPTPPCRKRCQAGYRKSFPRDKYFGRKAYRLPNSVKAIQREIMTNGPVVAAFTTYEDFKYYKRGIYRHTGGDAVGGHAVKVIGWGTENGVPYWIIANSWHDDWGEDGYFRFIRGINDCGIEEDVVAGSVQGQ